MRRAIDQGDAQAGPDGPDFEARVDHDYARAGLASLFMLFAPQEGWRHVAVRARRTAVDYAHILAVLTKASTPLRGRSV